jgi:hypothetical protein
VVAAALVICVAQLSLVQMTTWMPKYFAEIGRGGAPPIVFIASSAFAAPLLAMAAPLIKRWNPNALVLAITSGSACLSVGFAIVPWAEGVHPLLPIGVLVLTSIVAELTVVPSTNVFVARVTSRHWLGLAFGVVSLSESVGGIAGVYLGAQLFAQAVGGDGLSTYWFRIAAVTAMLLAATYAVKVVADVAISILSKRL